MPEMKLSDREMICLVLDKRTVGRELILDKQQWKDAIEKFKIAYSKFYVTQRAFDRNKQKEQSIECEIINSSSIHASLKEPTAQGNGIYDLFSYENSDDQGDEEDSKLSEDQQQVLDKVAADVEAKKVLRRGVAWELV